MSVAKKLCQAVSLVAVLGISTSAYGLAFPGAVGFGKDTIGGRSTNTKIIFVDTLADAYPDAAPAKSLREALNTSGPRIIIFRVGGVINLAHDISPASGNITIAGQTAPGQGIVIRGHTIRFRRNEIICRGVRFRPGDKQPNLPAPSQTDGLKIGDSDDLVQPTNIIVDHCSVSWSKDEMVELGYGSKNVTLSNNVFAEPLWHTDNVDSDDPFFHGFGSLVDGPTFRHQGLTYYRNLFATSMRRNPWIKSNASVEFVNNVIHNWYSEGLGIWGGTAPKEVNVIGNYFKAGHDTQQDSRAVHVDTDGKASATGTKIYIRDNVGPNRAGDPTDDWAVATVELNGEAKWRQSSVIPTASSTLPNIQVPIAAWTSTMQNAGAQPRDGTDARVVSNALRNPNVALFIDSVSAVPGPKDGTGYPAYYGGPKVTDNDQDGMADAWEVANNLNPTVNDAKVMNGGYLNIENYINSLIGTNVANTYQAEAALPTAGSSTLIEDAHVGFTGLGYVNFPLSNGTLTFSNVDGRGGGTKVLQLRYAFPGTNRTGTISVNGGPAQSFTMTPTAGFTTWTTMNVTLTTPLNNNSTNTIVIKSTGTDLGNLDWIAVQ